MDKPQHVTDSEDTTGGKCTGSVTALITEDDSPEDVLSIYVGDWRCAVCQADFRMWNPGHVAMSDLDRHLRIESRRRAPQTAAAHWNALQARLRQLRDAWIAADRGTAATELQRCVCGREYVPLWLSHWATHENRREVGKPCTETWATKQFHVWLAMRDGVTPRSCGHPACTARVAAQRAARAANRAARDAATPRICVICGASLQGRRGQAVTCSARCRQQKKRGHAGVTVPDSTANTPSIRKRDKTRRSR